MAELYIERRGARSIVGNIYKGRVDNVLPGLEAAFVDIGLEKNGFLHVDEIVLPGVEIAAPRPRPRQRAQSITDLLKPGQEVVVQVVKDPLKTKGARLSMELTIAGRYMVYAPHGRGRRRLAPARRQGARAPAQGGGQARPARRRRDHPHRGGRAPSAPTSSASCSTSSSSTRCSRSASRRPTAPDDGLPGGRPLGARRARHLLRPTSSGRSSTTRSSTTGSSRSSSAPRPSSSSASSSTADDEPLFERYGVEKVIEGVLSSRVDLPTGGYLMIDYAEALTVIDVNSGSFIGRGKTARLEDTITKTNLEAAEEVVNQLRLRDIGGIIVIDFIDMARARNRDAVLKTLRKSLDEDRTKTYVVEISPLGPGRDDAPERHRGRARDHDPAVPDLRRRGRDRAPRRRSRSRSSASCATSPRRRDAEAFLVQINPRVSRSSPATAPGAARARGGDRQALPLRGLRGPAARPLRRHHGGRRARRSRSARCPSAGRRGPRAHRRAPHVQRRRRGGEDRRLHHLGHGGGRYVGEKRLVRIEEAGRTAATAVARRQRQRARRKRAAKPAEKPAARAESEGEEAAGRRRTAMA